MSTELENKPLDGNDAKLPIVCGACGDNCEKNMCQESRLPGKRPLAAQLLDTKAELKGSREDVRKLQSLARHDGKAKK